MHKISGRLLFSLLILAVNNAILADSYSSAISAAADTFSQAQLYVLVKQVESSLTEHRVQVAIIARAGSRLDALPEGLHFTHVGFAMAVNGAPNREIAGNSYITYNLYQRDDQPSLSALEHDSLSGFFSKIAVLEAGVIIPSPELQRRLLALIRSPTYQMLHQTRYSLIASPYATDRQNCTGFVLDVTVAALHQTNAIAQIKSIERNSFKPQQIKLSRFKLLLAALFSSDVSLEDYPNAETTTFETIASYLKIQDPGSVSYTVAIPPAH